MHAAEYSRRVHAVDIASTQFEPRKGNSVMISHVRDGHTDTIHVNIVMPLLYYKPAPLFRADVVYRAIALYAGPTPPLRASIEL